MQYRNTDAFTQLYSTVGSYSGQSAHSCVSLLETTYMYIYTCMYICKYMFLHTYMYIQHIYSKYVYVCL
jgi:hypothetical protein